MQNLFRLCTFTALFFSAFYLYGASETPKSTSGGIDDYQLFKVAERMYDIAEKTIDECNGANLDKTDKAHESWPSRSSYWMPWKPVQKGLMLYKENGLFRYIYTPWGARPLVGVSHAHEFAYQLRQHLLKYVVLTPMSTKRDNHYNTAALFEVSCFDGKQLPPAVLRKHTDCVLDKVVASALHHHQERYKKEKALLFSKL